MIFKHYQGSAPVVISDSESDVEVYINLGKVHYFLPR